jgi:hypothetical protein
MKIQLNSEEISSAIEKYISDMGVEIEGKEIDIEFTPRRKEKGVEAEVAIGEAKTKKVGRPKGSKNKAQETPDDASEPTPALEPKDKVDDTTKLFN